MTTQRDANGSWIRETELKFRGLADGSLSVLEFLDPSIVALEYGPDRAQIFVGTGFSNTYGPWPVALPASVLRKCWMREVRERLQGAP